MIRNGFLAKRIRNSSRSVDTGHVLAAAQQKLAQILFDFVGERSLEIHFELDAMAVLDLLRFSRVQQHHPLGNAHDSADVFDKLGPASQATSKACLCETDVKTIRNRNGRLNLRRKSGRLADDNVLEKVHICQNVGAGESFVASVGC